MSEAEYYWPSEDQPGKYTLERRAGDEKDWEWDGAKWRRGIWFRDTSQMIEWGGYLGVRREPATLTPTPKTITPDSDDGNAMVAQEALNELRMCRKSYQFERWSIKWGKPLTEMLGAR